MKAAKDRKEEFFDPTRKDNILGRNTTRLELWEEHFKDPIVAPWLEALWKQGSNGMRSGGVGSDATDVGRGPVAFSGCLG